MTTAPPTPAEIQPEPRDDEPPRFDDPQRPTRTMAIGWVVAGAVVIGLLSAIVLDVVAFNGAREHVTPGRALLAFALGGGLTAVGSTRLTDQPQRWAVVPCAAMGLTGVAVLLLARSNRVMEDL